MAFGGISGAYWVGVAGMTAAAVPAVRVTRPGATDGSSATAGSEPTLRGVAAASHTGVFLAAGIGLLVMSTGAQRASRQVVIPRRW